MNELKHYGVKGQKWGVKRSGSSKQKNAKQIVRNIGKMTVKEAVRVASRLDGGKHHRTTTKTARISIKGRYADQSKTAKIMRLVERIQVNTLL